MITIATIYIDFVHECATWFLIYIAEYLGPYVILMLILIIMEVKILFFFVTIIDKRLKTSILLCIISLHLTGLALMALDFIFFFCFHLERADIVIDKTLYVKLAILTVFIIVCMDSDLLDVALCRIIKKLYNDYT